jgi:hypothetical protein
MCGKNPSNDKQENENANSGSVTYDNSVHSHDGDTYGESTVNNNDNSQHHYHGTVIQHQYSSPSPSQPNLQRNQIPAPDSGLNKDMPGFQAFTMEPGFSLYDGSEWRENKSIWLPKFLRDHPEATAGLIILGAVAVILVAMITACSKRIRRNHR